MLKNMKIKKKLLLAFITVTILASISGIICVYILQTVNRSYRKTIQNYGFAQGDIGKIIACFGSVNVSVHDSISYMDITDQNKVQDTYNTQSAKMTELLADAEKAISDSAIKEKLMNAKNAWEEYLPLSRTLMAEGDTEKAETILAVQKRMVNELDPLYNTIHTSLSDVMSLEEDTGYQAEDWLNVKITKGIIFVNTIIVIALVLSIVLGTAIAKSIADPMHKCAKRLIDLSKGDLTSPVPHYTGKDEIGILARSTETIVTGLTTIIKDEKYLLEEMADGNFNVYSTVPDQYIGDFTAVIEAIRTINHRLSDTLSQINQSSDQVSGGSQQVSGASRNLSQGAAEQASSIEGLASTIENISEQIALNAENAQIASDKAQTVGTEMEKSNEKMQNMIQAMNEINSSSSEIGKIIKTIEDIAFQTNILALNAAVEAARAGTAGKGFAVVADEVRNLASKSAEASKNTAQLIEASIKAVENGTKIADETADTLISAVKGAGEVVSAVEKISKSSAEQAESIEHVTRNVEQISGVVQTNSATAEESAAASEELSTQAQMLRELVSRFRLRTS